MLVSAINLTQAARSGAVQAIADYNGDLTSPSTEATDASTAAEQELGVTSLTCKGDPSGSSTLPCLSVSHISGTTSGETQIKVRIWQSIVPFLPLIPSVTVSAYATAGTDSA